MSGWNPKQDFTPIVRLGESVVRLSKIALYHRLKGIEPELKKAGVDFDLQQVFQFDPAEDLRRKFEVPKSSGTKSFLSVVETSNSKF